MKSSKTLLILILILATFLRFYLLRDLHPFIADQGWFYLSARDLLSGNFPLVGITASYTWLHQGALWTYMLAPLLLIFNYDPVGGAYLSAALGVLGVFMIYVVGKTLFKSEEMGLISAALLAASPLSIAFSRTPYHTSPISLAVLVFIFALYKYAIGKYYYLLVVALMLGILYNLALVNMILWAFAFLIILKVRYFNLKLYVGSFISFIIPMIPMILYDFQMNTGYYQITAMPRLVKVALFDSGGFNAQAYLNVLDQLLVYNQLLILSSNKFISIVIIGFSLLFIIWQATIKRKSKFNIADYILGLWVFMCLIGIFLSRTPSAAYLPMFLPGIILLISYVAVKIIQKNFNFRPIIYSLLILILISNVYLTLSTLYLTKKTQAITIRDNKILAREIVKRADGRRYNLIRAPLGGDYEDLIQNYEYLTWLMGNAPSKDEQNLIFIVDEKERKIYTENEEKN